MPRALPGLRARVPEVDDLLVDLWGVVHDGERPFAGVVETLEAIAAAGRRVIFVSNTSREGVDVVDSLVHRMGIDRGLFLDVVSSGDVTRAALERREPALFGALPAAPRCFHFGSPSYVPWLFQIGLEMVEDVRAADLVIATGAPDARGLDAVRAQLAPAAARDVPLVCTNPDRVVPSAKGLNLGPGAVAQTYAALGGRVFLYGKPHPPIYTTVQRRLGETGGRRVAVGDLLDTDVRGAQGAGIASVLVTGTGGHAADLGSSSAAEALFARESVTPDMLLERFAW